MPTDHATLRARGFWTLARGTAVTCLLDSRDGAVLQLDRPERRDRASFGAAHGPRHFGAGRRTGGVNDGRGQSGRALPHRLTARSLLRPPRQLRLTRTCRAWYVRVVRRAVTGDGRPRRRPDRLRHGP